MECIEFNDLFESYVLGELEGAEREALEEHLGRGCEVCMRELNRASELNARIFGSVARLNPAAGLRARTLAAFGIDTRPRRVSILPWTLAAVATVAAVLGNVQYGLEPAASARMARGTQTVEFLGLPGTRQVSFGAGSAPHGSVLMQREKGLLLVVVNLPSVSAGKMYEAWMVPARGGPQPLGPLLAPLKGQSVTLIPGPFRVDSWKAVAVSVETKASSPPAAPTAVLFAAAMDSR